MIIRVGQKLYLKKSFKNAFSTNLEISTCLLLILGMEKVGKCISGEFFLMSGQYDKYSWKHCSLRSGRKNPIHVLSETLFT